MLDAPNLATIIVLTRDKGEGIVTTDRDGEPVISYTISPYDRQHLLHGLRTAARVHLAAGAKAVVSLQNKMNRVDRFADGTVSMRDLSDFDARLERYGMGPNRMMMFSAHQMGTCRMGVDPKTSVTNEHGEVHGVKGLFVCDGSLFPAASGVNPMLTIMGLAHCNSQYIKTVI
jgi:choline dehydrogenase-like flavoprotein